MSSITVRDVLRLALPPETIVVAGATGLTHPVTWVTTLRATLPAFVHLRGGEIALVPIAAAQALDHRLTLATLIERLTHVPIAALAIVGAIPDDARQSAETAHLPLLCLPDTCDTRDVEREIRRLISDYDAQLERRGAQLAHLLTTRSLTGSGVPGLIDILAQRTGRAVGYYRITGELRTLKARGPARVALQTLRPTTAGPMAHLGQSAWIQPLGTGNDRLGYLVIVGEDLDAWDRIAIREGAAVLALELAKEQAIQATETRLRGDFVHMILTGPPADAEALLQRGHELGYNLRHPHIALLCTLGDTDDTASEHLIAPLTTALTALGLAAPTMRRADGLLCYLPLTMPNTRPRELAEQIRAKLAPTLPNLHIALGKEAINVTDWSRSLREAEQALLLGRHLLDTSHVLDFGDLGVYRLLVLLRETPELWDFYHTTLATLVEYDRRQETELVKTLEAFFAHTGNLARTATALHIHRNTLLYRLGRINEISGLDLDDPEERLALWLALKTHRVLFSFDTQDPTH